MKRYEHIYTLGSKLEEVTLKDSKWSKEIQIDMSLYQPESELVKQIEKRRNLTGDEVKAFYDFANGKDTGKTIPKHRQAATRDFIDIANDIRDKQNEIKDKIDTAKEIASYQTTSTGNTTE